MFLTKLATALSAVSLAINGCNAIAIRHLGNSGGNLAGSPMQLIKPYLSERAPLQDIVTWDNTTLFVRGERVMIYSGEFHPFRLPVPSLWLDVLQKIKSLGYNCVSFYVDWALLEGTPGEFSASGVFAWEPFFEAASEAGIYLIARPGPYINAEASGGGFPGWLQRVKGRLRTRDADYLDSTRYYMNEIGKVIAKGQITNGGPIILFQPENEYTVMENVPEFPDGWYMQQIEDAFREAGIVVPYISNDASPKGYNAPGTGEGEVDIYGHDNYPLGFDCARPTNWPINNFPTKFRQYHMEQSPTTPYSVLEFQGGSFDPWGGLGFEQCSQLINHEFERVFFKNMFAAGVTIFNIYMTYGGTNWGNLGHPGGYTSYDYGAVIREDRRVDREKTSEAKLEAIFITSSPAYMTSVPQTASTSYTSTADLTVTPLFDLESETKFWVLRHTAYNSLANTPYKLILPTSAGVIEIPQTLSASGEKLTLQLNGRDSKIHVTDYKAGGWNLLYSSAEVFTVKKFSNGQTHLVVYGGPNEFHELSISKRNAEDEPVLVEGTSGSVSVTDGDENIVVGFTAGPERRVLKIHSDIDLFVHLLDRNTAYNYWLPSEAGAFDHSKALIVSGGYLIRNAKVSGTSVNINGDVNATTTLEVFGAPGNAKYIKFNGKQLKTKVTSLKSLLATVEYNAPEVKLPDLKSLQWRYTDSLPELSADYDDSKWTVADKTTTNNTLKLTTPYSLYASDYGYHTGSLVYRGHYTSNGNETTLTLRTAGGSAFGMSAWLNGKHLGSWPGNDKSQDNNSSFTLPALTKGTKAVITVLVDHMGLNQNWVIGTETMKFPRGVLSFDLVGRDKSDVQWKLTGNLGGEQYADKIRGPLNEGGVYAERQGWHLPSPPSDRWAKKSPFEGIESAGVGFYTTDFKLNLPKDYDIPVAFSFANVTSSTPNYRAHIYVNGWQYGKYVHNVGPQDIFPIPQGILNHQGTNSLAVSLWALDTQGAKLDDVSLIVGTTAPAQWKFPVETVKSPKWSKRKGAY